MEKVTTCQRQPTHRARAAWVGAPCLRCSDCLEASLMTLRCAYQTGNVTTLSGKGQGTKTVSFATRTSPQMLESSPGLQEGGVSRAYRTEAVC